MLKPLLSSDGITALQKTLARRPLLAFDFDGTLAPIVVQPADASMSSSAGEWFNILCAHMPVAVISGRDVEDVRKRLAATPRYVIGNHGVEGFAGIEDNQLFGWQSLCAGWARQLVALRSQFINDGIDRLGILPGIFIEQKKYSVCLHYREATDHTASLRLLETWLKQLTPPAEIVGGKCAINLVPSGAPDKRVALEKLLKLEETDSTFFCGDDDNDEVVFRNAPPSWVTVRVGNTPASAARFFLKDQDDITECLQWLVRLSPRAS